MAKKAKKRTKPSSRKKTSAKKKTLRKKNNPMCPKCGYNHVIIKTFPDCPMCKACSGCRKPLMKCNCIEGE